STIALIFRACRDGFWSHLVAPRPTRHARRQGPRLNVSSPAHDPHMKPCISAATTMSSAFAEDLQAFTEGGCPAMEVWLTKLETHLEKHQAPATRKEVQDRGLTLAAAAYQGGLLLSQGEARKAHFDHFKRRLDLCQFFSIPTLLLVADFVEKIEPTALERAVVSLK